MQETHGTALKCDNKVELIIQEVRQGHWGLRGVKKRAVGRAGLGSTPGSDATMKKA